MLKGFQQFILRGNVLDLAVAVVMGAAFGGVVTALVKDLLTPLIAAIVGKPDFSAIAFEVNGSKFLVWGFHQRAGSVSPHCCSRILLRDRAGEYTDGAFETRRSSSRPHNEKVP
jgi:hypothetical protein